MILQQKPHISTLVANDDGPDSDAMGLWARGVGFQETSFVQEGPRMSRLIRMDQSGHTMVAQWTAGDRSSAETAIAAFRAELDRGFYALVSHGGEAEQVRELPLDAELVILRRPIAGG
jgi:hypothetical protein